MGDVLASEGEEGRGSLRKAWGSRQTGRDPEIPELTCAEFIGTGGKPRELKHLSTWRSRKKNRFRK
jgi:hypothetical protein